MNLRYQYKQETGKRCPDYLFDECDPDVQDYVEWLEKRLAEYEKFNGALIKAYEPDEPILTVKETLNELNKAVEEIYNTDRGISIIGPREKKQ